MCLFINGLPSPELANLLGIQLASHTALGANFSRRENDGKIGVDLDSNLDLAALLHIADGSLGKGVANLPYLLALLLFFLLVVGEVRLFVRVSSILDLGGLVLLGLGLRLGNLDVGVALDELDKNITAVFGRGDVDCPLGGDGSLGRNNRNEDLLAGSVQRDDTNGVADVGHSGDGSVGRLVDVVGLVILDQAGLESGATSAELGRVDGIGVGGGGQDSGGLGEDVAEVGSNARSVGSATRQNDFVNVKNVKAGLLDDRLNQAVDALENGPGKSLVTEAVDGAGEIDTVGQAFNAEAGVGTDAEGPLGGLGLELELGKASGVLTGVLGAGVALEELLGEVIHQDLVKSNTVELVVVGSGEDGVHALAAGNDGYVGAGAAQLGNDNDLVLDLSLGARIVGERRSDGLADQLENLEIGSVGSSKKSGLLLVVEVGRDGDDGRGDLLAKVIGSRADQATEVAGGNLGDGNSRRLSVLLGLVLDGERDGSVNILGVRRGVVVGRVDMLEATDLLVTVVVV